MRRILFLHVVLALAASGCSSVDLSNQQPFAKYVGCELPLQYPVVLVTPSRSPRNAGFLPRRRSAKYAMLIDDTAGREGWVWINPKKVAHLPLGHPIVLHSVREEITALGDRTDVVAYGRTRLPESPGEITFAYHWREGARLRAAPWEAQNAQSTR